MDKKRLYHMTQKDEDSHPFYGEAIFAGREQAYISKLLNKYRNEGVTEELKKKIWDELQMEKYHGRIKIPFKVCIRTDSTGKFPAYIEVILDTKL